MLMHSSFLRESLCLESHWVPGENISIYVANGMLEYNFSIILYLKQKIKKLLIAVSMKLDYQQLIFPLSNIHMN